MIAKIFFLLLGIAIGLVLGVLDAIIANRREEKKFRQWLRRTQPRITSVNAVHKMMAQHASRPDHPGHIVIVDDFEDDLEKENKNEV